MLAADLAAELAAMVLATRHVDWAADVCGTGFCSSAGEADQPGSREGYVFCLASCAIPPLRPPDSCRLLHPALAASCSRIPLRSASTEKVAAPMH